MATDDEVIGPVNIGNPHEMPVRELAERVIRLTGSKSRIVLPAFAARRSDPALPRHHPRQAAARLGADRAD